MLLSKIVRQGRVLRNLCYVRNYEAASRMVDFRIPPTHVAYDSYARSYWIAELGIRVGPAQSPLLGGLGHARALKRAGVQFTNAGTEIIAQAPAFKAAVENEDELFILKEVVADGVYNLSPSAPGAVVLDIGMNVGLASLQFAAHPRVAAVWAYEPVAATYRRALANFDRNPELALKIKPHNWGLSDADGEMTFDYSPRCRGAVGVNGMATEFRRYHRIENLEPVTVTMRNTGEVIRTMRVEYPGAELIVKMDCEGCEYQILSALRREKLLRQVQAFLIEWHKHGPTELVHTLADAGLATLSLMPREQTGMIYAFRRPSA